MNEETRHKLVWGWLTMFFGFAQMGMVAAAVGSLIVVGVARITVIFLIMATTFTVMSRLIYRGRSDPRLERKDENQ